MITTAKENSARYSQHWKHISSDINGMCSDIKDLRSNITDHCIVTAGLKAKVSDNKDEIDRLRKRTDVWSGVNSVMAFVAGAHRYQYRINQIQQHTSPEQSKSENNQKQRIVKQSHEHAFDLIPDRLYQFLCVSKNPSSLYQRYPSCNSPAWMPPPAIIYIPQI